MVRLHRRRPPRSPPSGACPAPARGLSFGGSGGVSLVSWTANLAQRRGRASTSSRFIFVCVRCSCFAVPHCGVHGGPALGSSTPAAAAQLQAGRRPVLHSSRPGLRLLVHSIQRGKSRGNAAALVERENWQEEALIICSRGCRHAARALQIGQGSKGKEWSRGMRHCMLLCLVALVNGEKSEGNWRRRG